MAVFGQWRQFPSEAAFYRWAAKHLRALFPTLPSRPQLNRLMRRHADAVTALALHLGQGLARPRDAYEVLDGIVEAYMEQNRSPQQIVAQGFAPADVRRVVGLIRKSEYKRRQAPPGVRITLRGFGKDWRYPITSHYRDEGGVSL